jgi:hypothetical protein
MQGEGAAQGAALQAALPTAGNRISEAKHLLLKTVSRAIGCTLPKLKVKKNSKHVS